LLSIQMLKSGMENKVAYSHIGEEWLHGVEGILMPGEGERLSETHIYFCTPEIAEKTLAEYEGKNLLTLFVSGVIKELTDTLPEKLNLIVIDTSLSELYNNLFRNFTRYSLWKNKLREVPVEAGGAKKLLQSAVTMSESRLSFYILTPAFKMIESCVAENQIFRISQRLNEGGYLSESQIAQCFEYIAAGLDENPEVGGNRIAYQMYPIRLGEEIQGYLFVIGITSFPGFNELIKLLTRELAKHLTRDGIPAGLGRREITKIMEDILLFMPEDIEGLRNRLATLPNKLGRYIRSIVISFVGEISVSGILTELDKIFPDGNVAPYSSYIVVLLSGENHLTIPEFNSEEFEHLLKKYDGYAVISNPGRYLRGLRTLFIQSKDALSLLPKLPANVCDKRCVYFEALREYYVIDLCAKIIAEHYGHDKLVYLAHPVVMEIMRYDMAHNSDMRDFLFTYIANDCSILNTSRVLHMHRNTVIYKLKKIQDILGIDLRDFTLRRELMFSCQVMQYTENIQHRRFKIDSGVNEQ